MTSMNEKEQATVSTEEKAEKIFIVNCNRCGAALKVKDGPYAYLCGACNNLFQIRKIEKIVQPVVSQATVEEATEKEEASVQLDISDIQLQPEETAEADELVEEAVEEAVEEVAEEAAEEEESLFAETEEGSVVTSEPIKPTKEEDEALIEQLMHEDSDAFDRYGYSANEVEGSAWEPATDEGEEDGWDDDDRGSELSEWQEEEAEEGWDEEDTL